ncbi:MAG: hypothetical protein ABID38_04950 [Candidatus Diapherotrites archaeon]
MKKFLLISLIIIALLLSGCPNQVVKAEIGCCNNMINTGQLSEIIDGDWKLEESLPDATCRYTSGNVALQKYLKIEYFDYDPLMKFNAGNKTMTQWDIYTTLIDNEPKTDADSPISVVVGQKAYGSTVGGGAKSIYAFVDSSGTYVLYLTGERIISGQIFSIAQKIDSNLQARQACEYIGGVEDDEPGDDEPGDDEPGDDEPADDVPEVVLEELEDILSGNYASEYTVKYEITYGNMPYQDVAGSMEYITTWYVKGKDKTRVDYEFSVEGMETVAKYYYIGGKGTYCNKTTIPAINYANEECGEIPVDSEKQEVDFVMGLEGSLSAYGISPIAGRSLLGEETKCFRLVPDDPSLQGASTDMCFTSDGILLYMEYNIPVEIEGKQMPMSLEQTAISLKRSADDSVFQ